MTDSDPLQRALDCHRSGNLRDAAAGYQEFLRGNPNHSGALYLLGCLAYQTGNPLPATDLLLKAVNIEPGEPSYYNALALAQMELQQYVAADASLQRALALDCSNAEFLNNLGTLRKKQNRLPESLAAYRQAINQGPEFADAHYNLGNALRAAGEPAKAIESFLSAVGAEHSHPHALAALGQTLRAENRAAEAILFLERAVSLIPTDAGLYCDLGDALQDAGRPTEALSAYRRAAALAPELARAWYSAGCAENSRKEYIPAIDCFEHAVAAEPQWLEARHNLARAFFQTGQIDQAMEHFRACAAQPHKFASISRGMIAVIIPGDPQSTNSGILNARRNWATQDLPRAPLIAATAHRNYPLRIGYLSSFFHRQNWMKPVWGLINQHDRSKFEIHLFSDCPASAIECGYRPHEHDRFHDISAISNHGAAELIRHCAIDLLVDLNGYSNMPRLPLLTMKPAPILIGWFNLYATTGMPEVDYLIGDHHVLPPEEEHFYTERILRVPGSYLTFSVDYPVPTVSDPPCLSEAGITFGCLASQYKLTNDVIAAWCTILHNSPASSLLLKNSELGSASTRDFVHGLFDAQGIAQGRVHLEGPAPHFEFLEAYSRVDIALDPFPYNGGTTTTEAIWQGVPVLTFSGDRWASRTSASLLRAANLDEFVAPDPASYIALASELSNSPHTPGRLAELRRNMRARLKQSPVCDTAAFARQMENIYAQVYEKRF